MGQCLQKCFEKFKIRFSQNKKETEGLKKVEFVDNNEYQLHQDQNFENLKNEPNILNNQNEQIQKYQKDNIISKNNEDKIAKKKLKKNYSEELSENQDQNQNLTKKTMELQIIQDTFNENGEQFGIHIQDHQIDSPINMEKVGIEELDNDYEEDTENNIENFNFAQEMDNKVECSSKELREQVFS